MTPTAPATVPVDSTLLDNVTYDIGTSLLKLALRRNPTICPKA